MISLFAKRLGGLKVQAATATKHFSSFNKNDFEQFSDEEWEKDLAAEDFEVLDDNVDESELDLDLK